MKDMTARIRNTASWGSRVAIGIGVVMAVVGCVVVSLVFVVPQMRTEAGRDAIRTWAMLTGATASLIAGIVAILNYCSTQRSSKRDGTRRHRRSCS